MSTELHWPRRSTFVVYDDGDRLEYDGPGTYEVPDDRVEQFRERGWEDPETDAGSEAPAAASQDTSEEPEEAEAEADGDGFDAAGFVDESWQAVVAAIEDGEADGHLADVREAEQDRDSPRSSVIEALDQRAG